jgi:hypothetical protein
VKDGLAPGPLVVGLLLPGAGLLLRGQVIAGLLAAAATAFFAWSGVLALIVANRNGYPAPLDPWSALAGLEKPIAWPPQVIVAWLFALAVHLTAAISASVWGPPAAERGAGAQTARTSQGDLPAAG